MNYKLEQDTKKKYSGWNLIKKYFQPELKKIAGIVVIVLIASVSGLIIPKLFERAIDVNLAANPADTRGLTITLSLVGVLAIVSIIATYFQIRLTGFLGQEVLFKIRKEIFDKMQELPLRFYAQNRSGDIIARISSDVESISRFLNEGAIRFLSLGFNMIAILIIMFIANVGLATIVLIGFFVILLILFFQGQLLSRSIKKSLDLDAKVSNEIQEILNGFKVIKSYGQEKNIFRKFQSANEKFFRFAMIANLIDSSARPILTLASSGITLLTAVIALNELGQGTLSKGEVLAFIVYLGLFFNPLRNVANLWKNVQSGLASSQRIEELMALKTNIIEDSNPYNPQAEELQGKVEFKNVCFQYEEGETTLQNIDFTINPKETLAIVGPTGGGKTTFVNLVTRLYDTTEGEVLVDGVNVKNWELDKLRGSIGYMLQDTFLFKDTVFNNLKYADDKATKKEMLEILDAIGAKDFVESLPKGIDTELEENGQNLSSGQRQLLALARLMLRRPKILILDEATSNIDTKTEKQVQRAIDTVIKGTTSFIIAHRLSTIKNADKIILIQNNTILESGTLEELLAKKGIFYEMWGKSLG